jgi:hypothetical protein
MPINTPTGYLDITNATLRGSKIVTTGNIGIANANPVNHLSVGSNLHINDTHSNVLQISGNINAASVVLGGISIAPTFDLEIITNTGNTTPYTVEFNNTATAFVTTANATIGDTLTASKLVGDGSGISAIQSSNVTDFASNVSRITALETSTALGSDLDDNSARITNLSSNLSDNSSRITTLESGDISISGDKTFTGEIIFESNVHMNGGNVLVANTVNMTVSDPIIELGSNNLNTNDLGIIMTRHGATNSNIALVYDESDDILRMGYTLNGASDSVISLDSNALSVSVQGALSAASVTTDDYLIHSGDTDTKVGFPTADTFTVTTANSERLRVDSSGNVGVGTTSPTSMLELAANGGSSIITLKRTNASNGGAKGGIRFTENTNGYNMGVIACLGDGANTSGALCFYTAASSTDSNVYLPTTNERMRIDSSGNVGIGTASPATGLHVRNPGGADIASSIIIQPASTTHTRGYAKIEAYPDATYGAGTGLRFYTREDSGSNFAVDALVYERMTIRNNGNVGIGTNDPHGQLHIGPKDNNHIYLASANNSYGWKLDTDDQSNGEVPFRIIKRTGGVDTTVLTIKNQDGNVGIGTTNPMNKLDVRSDNYATFGKATYNAAGWSGIRLGTPYTTNHDAYCSVIESYNNHASNYNSDLRFKTSNGNNASGNEHMRITSIGYIGIGTSAPAYKLHVSDGDHSVAIFGPNTTWSSYLVVGAGTDKTATNNTAIAQCISTNGNLHLDAGHNRDIYMNHYSGAYIHHSGSGVSSDDRLKSEEELITNATDTLLKLSPQKYLKKRTLREDEHREPVIETGLIAQDIWYDAPELRHIVLPGADADPTENKPEAPVDGDIQQDPDYSSWGPNAASVNYDGLIAYLVKSNQELHGEIQTLKARITSLENA